MYTYTHRHTVQKKNQRAVFDMNILSKKQIVGEQGNFKLEMVWGSEACCYRVFIKREWGSWLAFTLIDYYNGGFQRAGDWLKGPIYNHQRHSQGII